MPAWLPVPDVVVAPDGTLRATVEVPPGSAWFDGHFPERAVLPGVALVGLATALARRHVRWRGQPVELDGVRRFKFKREVAPGARLEVVLGPAGPPLGGEASDAEVGVTFGEGGEEAASGFLLLRTAGG